MRYLYWFEILVNQYVCVCLTVMKAHHQSADAWKNCLMSRVRSYKELYMFKPIVLYINYFWGYFWCMPKIKSINLFLLLLNYITASVFCSLRTYWEVVVAFPRRQMDWKMFMIFCSVLLCKIQVMQHREVNFLLYKISKN